MLRRLLLLTLAAAWLAACAVPGGAPQAQATATPSGADSTSPPPADTATPILTATPTPAAFDETREPPAIVEPPPATLTIAGQSQVSGIGTFCWNDGTEGAGLGMCVDKMGVPTPLDPLQVASVPFTAEFTFPLEQPPSSVSLTLIPVTPESEMEGVTGTPGWRWWPFGQGQSVEVPPGVTTAVELSPAPGLYALTAFTFFEGRGDVVYGFLVQVGEVGGGSAVAFTLPASCQPYDNLSPYVDPGGRYCLLFPSHFRLGDVTLDRANFYGPALDESVEPVFASLAVMVVGPAGGRTLTQVVDDYIAANGGGLPITRSALTLSNEAAELVDGLPGRTGSWQAFAVHNDTIYQLSLYPRDDAFPQAAPDVEAVWNAVSGSFTFLQ